MINNDALYSVSLTLSLLSLVPNTHTALNIGYRFPITRRHGLEGTTPRYGSSSTGIVVRKRMFSPMAGIQSSVGIVVARRSGSVALCKHTAMISLLL